MGLVSRVDGLGLQAYIAGLHMVSGLKPGTKSTKRTCAWYIPAVLACLSKKGMFHS